MQAEDGIRVVAVTGVQTCALPICGGLRCLRSLVFAFVGVCVRWCLSLVVVLCFAIVILVVAAVVVVVVVVLLLFLLVTINTQQSSSSRSEERRVGKECRSRRARYHFTKRRNS